ncbi:MAG: DUF1080 domain-containing protein [Phycisphaerae bacterium]|nr:DUF1080 domain-containing protein [Phycisphaerae bacterium]
MIHRTFFGQVALAVILLLGAAGPVRAQEDNKPPAGFRALFNGTDLAGWWGASTEDPRKYMRLSPDAFAARQAKSRQNVNQHWKAENGELVNDGKGLYLTTNEFFGDFELLVDYKTVARADSGIYLRGCPQVQIWDSTDKGKWKIGADKGSGGLWNNNKGSAGKDPLVLADKPFGQWNRFRIKMVGDRVWVWLNGKQVVDNAVMHNYFDRKGGMFPRGPIQLQTHGGEIRWRNVFIREIPRSKPVAATGVEEGFTPLFNGKDLAGWEGAVKGYVVEDGNLVCVKKGGGKLYTAKEYGNFILRFDFKLETNGNNGVGIRCERGKDAAYHGMEIQILDNGGPAYKKLKPWQYHGSIYGVAAAMRGFQNPAGEWNSEEIEARGNRIRVKLNGSVIVDADLAEAGKKPLSGRGHPGLMNPKGYIAFLGHGHRVDFRNIRIKELD